MSSKIQMIKGETTPAVFCGKLVEISGDIEYIACAIQFKDGSGHVYNTAMPNNNIAWLRWIFDQNFRPEKE